jgi:MFS family permease
MSLSSTLTSRSTPSLMARSAGLLLLVTLMLLGMNLAKLQSVLVEREGEGQRAVLRQAIAAQAATTAPKPGPEADRLLALALAPQATGRVAEAATLFDANLVETAASGQRTAGMCVFGARLALAGQDRVERQGDSACVALATQWLDGSRSVLAVEFSTQPAQASAWQLVRTLLPLVSPLFALAVLIILLLGPHIGGFQRGNPALRNRQMTVFLGGLLLALHVALSAGAYQLVRNLTVQGAIQVAHVPQAQSIQGLLIEFMVVLVVGAMFIHEFVLAFMTTQRPRSGSVARLRFPLFLFVFGLELARPFAPAWANELALGSGSSLALTGSDAIRWFDADQLAMFAAALPVSVTVAALGLSAPLWNWMVHRSGGKTVLYAGIVMGLGSMAAGWAAESLPGLIVSRILAGVAYGAAAVIPLAYARRSRAQGMAIYFGAYVAAAVSGAGAGALLSDRLGYGAVFALGIICIGITVLHTRGLTLHKAKATIRWREAWRALPRLMRHGPFVNLVLLVSVPMQVLQHGVLFVWLPLFAIETGHSPVVVGIGLMAYFLAAFAVKAGAAQTADLWHKPHVFAHMGLVLSIAGLLLAHSHYQPVGVALASGLLGAGWALTFAPVGQQIARIDGAALSLADSLTTETVYRGLEKMLAFLAPWLVVVPIAVWGGRDALLALAACMGLLLITSIALLTPRAQQQR